MRRADVRFIAAIAAALLPGASAAGTAAAGDTTPPAVAGTPSVMPPVVDVSGGMETVHVEARLTDDTGVAYVLFTFVSLADPETDILYGNPVLMSGTPADGVWAADVTVDPTATGTLNLRIIADDDAFNQLDTVTGATLTITGGDPDPPGLDGDVTIEPASVDLSSGPVDVTVTIPLMDDVSGVSSVDATFIAGDTLTAGSATAELVSGDLHGGVWRAVVTIDDTTPAGVYPLAIEVHDFAGNAAYLGGPPLTVGGGDAVPPHLSGDVIADPPIVELTGGDAPLRIDVPLADASGVSFMSVSLEDTAESGVAFAFGARISGDSLDGVWRVDLLVPGDAPAGAYAIVVYAEDVPGNGVEFTAPPVVTLTRGDAAAPVLVPPTLIEPDTADIAAAAVPVLVRTGIADDGTGVVRATARFTQGGAPLAEEDLARVSGDSLSGTWEGFVTVPASAAEGAYDLVVHVADPAGNAADRLPGVALVVRRLDTTPPALSGPAALDPLTVNVSAGDRTVTATFTLTDDRTGVAEAIAELRPVGFGAPIAAPAVRTAGDSLGGTWHASIVVPSTTPAVVLGLRIVAEDAAGNRAEIDTGLLLHVERDVEARVTFRADLRGAARCGLFRPDLGMRVLVALPDVPAPGFTMMDDLDRDSVYTASAQVPVGTPVHFSFTLDPGAGDSTLWIPETTGPRDLVVSSSDPVTLDVMAFDGRGPDVDPTFTARVTRTFTPGDPDSVRFDDGPAFTDLEAARVSGGSGVAPCGATRAAEVARRRPASPSCRARSTGASARSGGPRRRPARCACVGISTAA